MHFGQCLLNQVCTLSVCLQHNEAQSVIWLDMCYVHYPSFLKEISGIQQNSKHSKEFPFWYGAEQIGWKETPTCSLWKLCIHTSSHKSGSFLTHFSVATGLALSSWWPVEGEKNYALLCTTFRYESVIITINWRTLKCTNQAESLDLLEKPLKVKISEPLPVLFCESGSPEAWRVAKYSKMLKRS